ncbi:MAG: hypothetical protein HOI23_08290 [Deltaproteobacteria bacterium]|nr:hypothetical protein [Deltaproteobacteria bacterium]
MGHWLACLKGRPGERYILGGHNLTYKELGMMVCEIANVAKPKHELKTGLISFIGKINEWISDNITHKEPLIVDKAIQYTGGRYLWVDVSKAKRELGYDPGPIDVAIKDSVSWFMGGRGKALEMKQAPQLTEVKA